MRQYQYITVRPLYMADTKQVSTDILDTHMNTIVWIVVSHHGKMGSSLDWQLCCPRSACTSVLFDRGQRYTLSSSLVISHASGRIDKHWTARLCPLSRDETQPILYRTCPSMHIHMRRVVVHVKQMIVRIYTVHEENGTNKIHLSTHRQLNKKISPSHVWTVYSQMSLRFRAVWPEHTQLIC